MPHGRAIVGDLSLIKQMQIRSTEAGVLRTRGVSPKQKARPLQEQGLCSVCLIPACLGPKRDWRWLVSLSLQETSGSRAQHLRRERLPSPREARRRHSVVQESVTRVACSWNPGSRKSLVGSQNLPALPSHSRREVPDSVVEMIHLLYRGLWTQLLSWRAVSACTSGKP